MPSDRSERTGYPTQKPLELYKRILASSSNEDDIILDPFAGCATTLIAAEKLGRRWVGIDIWDNAAKVVLERLEYEGLVTKGGKGGKHSHLFTEDVTFTSELPARTDDGQFTAPTLRTKIKVFEPHGPKMTRAEMYKHLLSQKGCKCQGCDRTFDDPRLPGSGPQHAALRQRHQPHLQPDTAVRAVQSAQEQYAHPDRTAAEE